MARFSVPYHESSAGYVPAYGSSGAGYAAFDLPARRVDNRDL